MSNLVKILTSQFELFRTAYFAGVLMAAMCGFVGTFVVLRKLSFMADTLAHGALMGIGLGYVIALEPQSTIIPFSVILAIIMTWLARNRKEDIVSLTAVVFSISVGLGILILSRFSQGGHELIHILFGNLLWIFPQDLLILFCAGMPVVLFLWIYRKKIVLIHLNEDLAAASGVRTGLYEYLFMVCVAVIIAVCMKLIGVVLVTALITIPALIAVRLTRTLNQQFFVSTAIATLCALAGMTISVGFDLPSGASIASTCGVLYILVALGTSRS